MAYEVEMKAWVDDWERVERYLRSACEFERSFRKEDRYYSHESAADGFLFRVRIDPPRAYVTFKEKRVRGGAEVNLEREFTVDDASAFVELQERLGAVEAFAKVKEGLHFRFDGLTVELVHVHELGDFLEIEFVHDDDDDELHDAAVARIRRFLDAAGIAEDRVEPRPYMKLLRDARGT
ncbi:MAG: class IV adenylate cyclase [Spirochaetota bacterium]